MRGMPDAELADLAATVAVARLVLGPGGAHPGAAEPASTRASTTAAAARRHRRLGRRLAGHPRPRQPGAPVAADRRAGRRCSAAAGFTLRERLTIYPEYVRRGDPWLDPRLAAARGGAGRPGDRAGRRVGAAGRAGRGRSPTTAFVPSGRTDLHATIDTTGRTGDRRGDFDRSTATGPLVADRARRGAVDRPRRRRARAGLRLAAADPAALLSPEHEAAALALFERRRRRRWTTLAGSPTTCAATRSATTSPTWSTATSTSPTSATSAAGSARSPSASATPTRTACRSTQVADRAEEAWRAGATEVCMQGGIDPKLPVTAYADLVRAIKERVPGMHVHAFSPDGDRDRRRQGRRVRSGTG